MSGNSKKFFLAASLLIGTIIGAGIFGIPYVISKSGLIPGLFYFLVLGVLVILIHLFFGEIVLRTREEYRLPGFAKKYLGKPAEILTSISVAVGSIGALLAYLILINDFFKILFPLSSDLISLYLTLICWLILSFFIFQGIKTIAPIELFTNIIFFLIISFIFLFCVPKFNFSNLISFSFPLTMPNFLLPYGVILFSLVGWSAIPETNEVLAGPDDKKKLNKIIIFSILTSATVYFLFGMLVVGVSGKFTTPDALSGLMPFLGSKIIFFGALAGLITIADSFLMVALYLKNAFIFDLKVSSGSAFLISCGTPLILFLLGFRSFIDTIGFVGTVMGVIEGIIIVLIFRKAKFSGDKEPEYNFKTSPIILYLLMAILILGAIFQLRR